MFCGFAPSEKYVCQGGIGRTRIRSERRFLLATSLKRCHRAQLTLEVAAIRLCRVVSVLIVSEQESQDCFRLARRLSQRVSANDTVDNKRSNPLVNCARWVKEMRMDRYNAPVVAVTIRLKIVQSCLVLEDHVTEN
jgi:hypothetical protein